MKNVIFTFVGDDRPGLVQSLSRQVSACGGNWLESRLSHMAGKFAGIVSVAVPAARCAELIAALDALHEQGLSVVAAISDQTLSDAHLPGELSVLGNDRPGIVHEISSALASLRINIQELSSRVESAPMAGIPLFNARISVALPADLALEVLRDHLERIANALDIDIHLAVNTSAEEPDAD